MKNHRWLSFGALMLALALIGTPVLGGDPASAGKLRDLADGETRTFGCGDHQVTARRDGALVTLTIPEEGGESRTLKVDLSHGDGTVTTTEGVPTDGSAKGRLVIVKKSVTSGGVDEDVVTAKASTVKEPRLLAREGYDPPAIEPLFETSGTRPIKVRASDANLVSCPEGDTVMRLDNGDTRSYTCPKHGLVLESGKLEGVLRTVVIADDAGKATTEKGNAPMSFDTKTMGGDEPKYSGKPLSLDF